MKLLPAPLLAATGRRGPSLTQAAADDLNDARLPASELVGEPTCSVPTAAAAAVGYRERLVNHAVRDMRQAVDDTARLLGNQAKSALWAEPERPALAANFQLRAA